MKKFLNAIRDGFYYVVALAILAIGAFVPTTVVAWCVKFWIDLFS